jgi:hypothetical protein
MWSISPLAEFVCDALGEARIPRLLRRAIRDRAVNGYANDPVLHFGSACSAQIQHSCEVMWLCCNLRVFVTYCSHVY